MPTLDFKGKQFVYSHHLSVPFRELKIDAGKSLPGDGGPSLDDNLIIHGDNLDALKALLPKYAGKVDVIYIDPPYNTGNEGWAYNDNVNSPLMKEWLGNVVDGDDLERHDKWLCMMWPRLVLLRELLSENGTIWISIDDVEQGKLRVIMDEIFGEENLIANVIWQKLYTVKNSAQYLSDMHDHIQCYAKNKLVWKPNLLDRKQSALDNYKNLDDDPRGPWATNALQARNSYSLGSYAVRNPNGGTVSPPAGTYWRVSEKNFKELDKDNRIWWGNDGSASPRIKKFLSEAKQGVVPATLWLHSDVGTNASAKAEIRTIFYDTDDIFITPKPSSLIEHVLKIATNPNALILDSFAGSGTTGQAVQALNAKDGGDRKFILVETEDYADTITAERVRRVMTGVPNAKDEALKNGLGGSFTYCELGDPIDMDAFFDDSKTMPAYDQLARYIAYTATGEALDSAPTKPAKDWFIGEVGGVRLHLIYKAQKAFMRGSEAALDIETARAIAKSNTHGKPVYVFAAAKYMGQKELSGDFGITFCQLPYAIHRIMGDSPQDNGAES